MKFSTKVGLVILGILGFIALLVGLVHGDNFAIVNPAGQIAEKERNLMIFTLILSIIVIVPVFTMTFVIARKYRAENTKVAYNPDWHTNLIAESLWWGLPCLVILILSVAAWKTSKDLDPFKPINASTPSMTIQVVALDWKWLFIYPEQHIATVNYLQIPVGTPVDFQITSDAPMNSFWIPQLGGQIYAMPGMVTDLNLMADKTGDFQGLSANISGQGFAGMKFTATSVSKTDFNTWVQTVQKSAASLNSTTYEALAKPSENNPVAYYAAPDTTLYDSTVMKFMTQSQASSAPTMSGMKMY